VWLPTRISGSGSRGARGGGLLWGNSTGKNANGSETCLSRKKKILEAKKRLIWRRIKKRIKITSNLDLNLERKGLENSR